MAQAQENDPDALLGFLKAGRYYSSMGPEIHEIVIEGDKVTARCSPAGVISLQGRGSRSKCEMGDGLETATFDLYPFKNGWFRVTVIDAGGRWAWSNPYWLD